MKWIKSILLAISVTIAGMFGGQKNKGVRRFGIPGMAIVAALFNRFRLSDSCLLLLIPILCMGYGENSFIYNLVGGNDALTRAIYGAFVSTPFLFYGFRRWLIALISLVVAFLVRAGSIGNIEWFGDILVEDIARYFVLGLNISLNIFFRKD